MAESPHGLLERRLKMRPIQDPVLRALINVQVATAHFVEDFEAVIGAEDLSLPGFNTLRILRGQPDGHPRSAIADRLIYRKTDVTRIIDRLERRGLVRRVRDKGDRRLSLTRITPKGLEALGRLDAPVNKLVDQYRALMPAREYAELNRLLDRLYAHKVE